MASDSSYSSTILVLGTGVNSRDSVIEDRSNSKRPVIVAGSTVMKNTQTKYELSNLYFDGTGDYLYTPYSTDFRWADGNFTIEAWIYVVSLTGWSAGTTNIPSLIGNFQPDGNNAFWGFGVYSSTGAIRFSYYNGSNQHVDSTDTVSLNTWTHIAMKHTGGNIYLYKNGNEYGPVAVSGTPQYSTARNIVVGMNNNSSCNGYVEALRVTKVARTISTPTDKMLLAGQFTGDITESTNVSTWDVASHNMKTKRRTGGTTSTGSTYTINVDTTSSCNIICSPHIDYLWVTGTTAVIGDLVVPSSPDTTPYLFECTTGGAVGGTEPTWNTTISGTTNDGSAVWTCKSALIDPVSLGPKIPT